MCDCPAADATLSHQRADHDHDCHDGVCGACWACVRRLRLQGQIDISRNQR